MNANHCFMRCFSFFRNEYEPQSTKIKILPTALFNYLLCLSSKRMQDRGKHRNSCPWLALCVCLRFAFVRWINLINNKKARSEGFESKCFVVRNLYYELKYPIENALRSRTGISVISYTIVFGLNVSFNGSSALAS